VDPGTLSNRTEVIIVRLLMMVLPSVKILNFHRFF